MKRLRPISILVSCLMLTAGATAQISLSPPGAETPPASKSAAQPQDKSKDKPKPKPEPTAKKPATPDASPKPAATPAPTATVTPAPPTDDPNVDLVFGAYQRGQSKPPL